MNPRKVQASFFHTATVMFVKTACCYIDAYLGTRSVVSLLVKETQHSGSVSS
jgi:hypothetical protein